MQLNEKVALVTGGTLGIGAAIVRAYAARGAHIATVARNVGEAANALGDEVAAHQRRFKAWQLDMGQYDDCLAAVERTLAEFGRIDILVHNAGGPAFGASDQITPAFWRATMALHVDALFYLTQAAIPHMRKQGEGAIITVSSTAGIRGVPGAIAYATAKGAVPQFTRCLARDLADFNIRVNCIAPGIIRTRFHDSMTPERQAYNLEHRIPLHREGTAEQVAEAVLLLTENDYITGETLVIDGGLTSRIV
jgi:NAD(P)-dependent dehydrogenase (short-subunit alcohol dehydrogenase family)